MNYRLKQEFLAHKGPLYSLCSGPEEEQFFSGGSDLNVLLWNIQEPEKPALIAKSPTTILSLLYLKEFNLLCIGQAEGGVHVLDLEKKEEYKFLKQHQGYIFNMQFIAEKKELVLASGDGSFSVWSVPEFKLLFQRKCSSKKIRGLAYDAINKVLAIGLGDAKIALWNVADWSLKQELKGFRSGVNVLHFLPNRTTLLSGEKDAYLTEVDLLSGNILKEIPAHNWAIYDLIDFPEEDKIVTASRDKTIKIWDRRELKVIKRLEGFKDKAHTHSVNKLLKLNRGMSFLSTGDDGKIKLWQEGD